MSSSERIVFFGSGDFAVPTLEALHQRYGSQLVQVVTQPDRPVGRKQVLQPTPVKVAAQRLGIAVTDQLNQIVAAEVGVVVYYGVIIPASVLEQFPFGLVNIHPSLLPRWRGPSPIRSALLAGDATTGVTIMRLDAGMDTGPIFAQKKQSIQQADTNLTLEHSLAQLGANTLLTILPDYLAGILQPVAQPTAGVTVSKMVRKEDGLVVPTMAPLELWNRYRALQPWPGIFFLMDNKRYKITQARYEAGRFLVEMIQPEGKQPMTLVAFKQGYPSVLFADII